MYVIALLNLRGIILKTNINEKGIINDTVILNDSNLEYYYEGRLQFGVLKKDNCIIDIFLQENTQGDSVVIECLKCILKLHTNPTISVLIVDKYNPILGLIICCFRIICGNVCDQGLIIEFSEQEEDNYLQEIEPELIAVTKQIMKRIRGRYYKCNPILKETRTRPLYGKVIEGMPTDSLGPFPEFILPTLPCKKTLEGYCTPCFFSKVEMNPGTLKDKYHSLIDQTKYIVDNYDTVVDAYQCRDSKDNVLTRYDVTICYACNGSFFSNHETSAETRLEALQLLNSVFKSKNKRPLVYIESCVDDYLQFIESPECKILLPVLKELNAFVLLGLESADHFSRDLLYLKNMDIESFEKIVIFNSDNGLGTGAFLYRGFHSLTQSEIISDTIISLYYLMKKNVMPVIMLPNLQEYSLTHLLYVNNRYNVLDPYTALTIVKLTMWFNNEKHSLGDDWLMGDLFGGPPAPKCSVFTNPQKTVCDKCANTIRHTLQTVRKNKKYAELYKCERAIKDCDNHCYEKYQKMLNAEKDVSLNHSRYKRAYDNICFANCCVDSYLVNMMSIKS